MANVALVLHVAAIVCWAIAAVGIPTPRVSMVPLGLFLWFLPAVVVV
jgi:hypothetical protein